MTRPAVYDFEAIARHRTSTHPDFYSRVSLAASPDGSHQGYDWRPNSQRARDLILDHFAHLPLARDIVNAAGWLPAVSHYATTEAYRTAAVTWDPGRRDHFATAMLDGNYTIEEIAP